MNSGQVTRQAVYVELGEDMADDSAALAHSCAAVLVQEVDRYAYGERHVLIDALQIDV